MRNTFVLAKTILIVALGFAAVANAADSVAVKGYVLDSSCVFTFDLEKPVSQECATMCAKGGSQLVILAEDGTIYWPIAGTMPATGQNAKLLPFAGQKVIVSGKVRERGGSKAIVIEKIEALQAEGRK